MDCDSVCEYSYTALVACTTNTTRDPIVTSSKFEIIAFAEKARAMIENISKRKFVVAETRGTTCPLRRAHGSQRTSYNRDLHGRGLLRGSGDCRSMDHHLATSRRTASLNNLFQS